MAILTVTIVIVGCTTIKDTVTFDCPPINHKIEIKQSKVNVKNLKDLFEVLSENINILSPGLVAAGAADKPINGPMNLAVCINLYNRFIDQQNRK